MAVYATHSQTRDIASAAATINLTQTISSSSYLAAFFPCKCVENYVTRWRLTSAGHWPVCKVTFCTAQEATSDAKLKQNLKLKKLKRPISTNAMHPDGDRQSNASKWHSEPFGVCLTPASCSDICMFAILHYFCHQIVTQVSGVQML